MKKAELGDKRPLSHGYTVDHAAKKAQTDAIQSQTDAFIASGGKVEYVASNVMKGDPKGHTALRIKPERDIEGFESK